VRSPLWADCGLRGIDYATRHRSAHAHTAADATAAAAFVWPPIYTLRRLARHEYMTGFCDCGLFDDAVIYYVTRRNYDRDVHTHGTSLNFQRRFGIRGH